MNAINSAIDLSGLLPELNRIVRQAGKIALDYRDCSPDVWHKHRGEPVSEADIAVDQFLLAELPKLVPDCALVSEESAAQTQVADKLAWVVDPIDGTRAFLRGGDDFAVSVALIEKGRPVIGSLYAPASGHHYSAILGHGAHLNAEPLWVSNRGELAGARMVAGRQLFREGGPTRGPWPELSLININSFALRIAEVACGKADAVLTLKAKADWDMAAADLILREAGGEISSGGITPPHYGTGKRHLPIIAATPALLTQIQERL